MQPGETVALAGYELRYEGTTPRTGPNFREDVSRFVATQEGGREFVLGPSKRYYAARQMTTTEAAIRTTGFSQLYLSVGDRREDGALAVRAYYKPWVTLIWIGTIFMSLGAAVSLSDRRLRVGVPRRATAARPARAEAS
jgi:cytochrome c-type biogenesis protein CcmF